MTLNELQRSQTSTLRNRITKNWAEVVYSVERTRACVSGEIHLFELHAVSQPELAELALVGYTLFEQGRYVQARDVFEGLSALDPNDGYYRSALGAIALAIGDAEGACRHCDEALRLNPSDRSARINRAEARLRQGKLREAKEDLDLATQAGNGSADPLMRRVAALAAATRSRVDSK
jgi:tetratricopeptide (TPR) repeat protein